MSNHAEPVVECNHHCDAAPVVKSRDPLDVDLVDQDLLNEVDLLVRLIVAARLSAGPLVPAELDQILRYDVLPRQPHR